MFELARYAQNHAQDKKKKTPVRTAQIAREQAIPEKFLELILVELRRSGFITSLRGSVGGHHLARPAEQIFIGDVWRAIDGVQARNEKSGKTRLEEFDPFCQVWADVDRAVSDVVDKVSLADILREAEFKRNVADYNI
jgi:Rrf2 family protein